MAEPLVDILANTDMIIKKYVIKKKRLMLCSILRTMGVNINLSICFPLKISLSELETAENKEILNLLCQNKVIDKYFSCRSLKPIGIKDKKRIQNVIKQMAIECDLVIKRSPLTMYNKLTNEKTTKQFYIITLPK